MNSEVKLLLLGSSLALSLCMMGGCAGHTPKPDDSMAHKQIQNTPLSGKVLETMNSGGYTYVLLETESKKQWVAIPQSSVAIGESLNLQPGMEMTNFNSNSLNRTFESIIFSGGPVKQKSPAPASAQMPDIPAHKGMMSMGQDQQPATPASSSDLLTGKVVETMNAGGYTYICLEKDNKKSWVAIPVATVKVGEDLQLLPGTEMGQFTSKTLNRTFENIIFSPGVVEKK